MTARIRWSRYGVRKVYAVICKDCNEDVSRPVTGQDVTTRAEADELMAGHDETFHGPGEPGSAAGASWLDWSR